MPFVLLCLSAANLNAGRRKFVLSPSLRMVKHIGELDGLTFWKGKNRNGRCQAFGLRCIEDKVDGRGGGPKVGTNQPFVCRQTGSNGSHNQRCSSGWHFILCRGNTLQFLLCRRNTLHFILCRRNTTRHCALALCASVHCIQTLYYFVFQSNVILSVSNNINSFPQISASQFIVRILVLSWYKSPPVPGTFVFSLMVSVQVSKNWKKYRNRSERKFVSKKIPEPVSVKIWYQKKFQNQPR